MFCITTGISAAIVQSFLVYRLFRLTKSWYYAGGLALAATAAFAGALLAGIQTALHRAYDDRSADDIGVTTWLIGSAVADIGVSVLLLLFLHQARRMASSFEGSRLNGPLKRMMLMTIETGEHSQSLDAGVSVLADAFGHVVICRRSDILLGDRCARGLPPEQPLERVGRDGILPRSAVRVSATSQTTSHRASKLCLLLTQFRSLTMLFCLFQRGGSSGLATFTQHGTRPSGVTKSRLGLTVDGVTVAHSATVVIEDGNDHELSQFGRRAGTKVGACVEPATEAEHSTDADRSPPRQQTARFAKVDFEAYMVSDDFGGDLEKAGCRPGHRDSV